MSLRILYLHQYFNTPSMSGGTRSYEMARRMVDAGHRVVMITSRRGAPDGVPGWHVESIDGIEVHWCTVPYGNHMGFAQRVRAFLAFAWHAAQRARSISADVVFATSTPLTIALPGVYAARRQRIPMVFEVRDLWPEVPIAIGALRHPVVIAAARLLERFAYRNSAQIVALSPGMRDGVVAAGYPADRITTVPNSSDCSLFDVPASTGDAFRAQHGIASDAPLFLYPGSLGRMNAVGYFVRVAQVAAERRPEARFLIVGEGAEYESVRTAALQAGLLDRSLFMMPPQPKQAMPSIFSAATVVVSLVADYPAMRANSANKVFDAFAAGKPLAVNYLGWQADLLEETGAGVVLDGNDPARGWDSLEALVSSPGRLAAAAAASRDLGRGRFDRDLLARELIAVVERAAGHIGAADAVHA